MEHNPINEREVFSYLITNVYIVRTPSFIVPRASVASSERNVYHPIFVVKMRWNFSLRGEGGMWGWGPRTGHALQLTSSLSKQYLSLLGRLEIAFNFHQVL